MLLIETTPADPGFAIQLCAAAAVATAAAALLVLPVRAAVTRLGMVAIPGGRGSHARPTPVGGGLAFVVPVSIAWLTAGIARSDTTLSATAVAGTILAATGFLDDQRGLRPSTRLAIQLACAVSVTSMTFVGREPWPTALTLVAVWSTAIVWSTNLFNFMDGLDGLAATEGLFVAGGASVLWMVHGGTAPIATDLCWLAGALAGFLPWNASRARIFMGDTGSTWLGFVLACSALRATVERPMLWSIWAILPALFVADATVCLVRRAARGEALAAAHRSHAYQNLARITGSHSKVVATAAIGNALLLAAAAVATEVPTSSVAVVAVSYAVSVYAVIRGRSGVPGVAESNRSHP